MIDSTKIERIVELFEAIMKRPKMYLGADDDAELANRFLWGFRLAFSVLVDIEAHNMINKWRDAVEAHGYRVNAISLDPSMEEKGMTKTQIVLEYIRIEQTMYRLLLESGE